MDRSPLVPAPPHTYPRLLALVPDTPGTAMARAAILLGTGAARVDDPAQPTGVAVRVPLPDGAASFFFGESAPQPDTSPRAFAACSHRGDVAQPFAALPPGGIRRLRPNDAPHLAPFPVWLWGAWETPDALLRAAPAYARYLRGELVSLACVAATTERYDVIAAYTVERARRNGFARECARRLIGAITAERGKQPVLVTAADDTAGIAFAHTLGLTARSEITGYVAA